ncbi:MAG: spermidine/putrescine ABC transporter substrate-binding protein [Firmicutes bacterium]|nr:spermidine/putrescine ABC transporter substrate-binding protein [Bacillota bacterium]
MKKILTFAAVLTALAAIMIFASGCSGSDDELYVYNWGEYISDGSEGSLDVISEFEDYYYELTGRTITVHYTTYPSNEDMYAKISAGTSSYDVIFPSDYMIERMISEGLLQSINIEEVCESYGVECNYQYIDDMYRGLFFDEDGEYSIPYTYGMVGIIYNTTMVDEADVEELLSDEDSTGWELLWNEKYSGKILQFNNSRDGFATAQYMLGIDVNSTLESDWRTALDKLLEQKPLVQSYVMDEIFNKMESGEAAIGVYYAGDYFTMLENNENLAFYYPTPTNVFVDCMCIPTESENPEIAALFINYMLSEKIAVANAEAIYYASPNSLVYTNEDYIEYMGEEAMEVLYPEDYNFSEELNAYAYRNLDSETLEVVSSLWEELKISGGMSFSVYVVFGVTAVVIIAAIAAVVVRKKKRERNY